MITLPRMQSFTFTALARKDFPLLGTWLRAPHVARWWADDASPEGLEADYGPNIDGTEPCEVFIASHQGVPVGFVQRYRLAAYPQYLAELAPFIAVPQGAASIDYLVGPPGVLRQGLGSALIRAFTQALWKDYVDTGTVIVPVHAENRASWRVLERTGYVRVGPAQLAPDNPADTRAHFLYRIDRPLSLAG